MKDDIPPLASDKELWELYVDCCSANLEEAERFELKWELSELGVSRRHIANMKLEKLRNLLESIRQGGDIPTGSKQAVFQEFSGENLLNETPEEEANLTYDASQLKQRMVVDLMTECGYTREQLNVYSVRQIRLHFNFVMKKKSEEAMDEILGKKRKMTASKPKPVAKKPRLTDNPTSSEPNISLSTIDQNTLPSIPDSSPPTFHEPEPTGASKRRRKLLTTYSSDDEEESEVVETSVTEKQDDLQT